MAATNALKLEGLVRGSADQTFIGVAFPPRIRVVDIKRPRVILKNVRHCAQERR